MKQKLLFLLVLLLTATTGAWATPNSIVINGTPQVGDKSISLTYHFDPNNVSGITQFAPTLKVKCAADNKWDEMTLSLHEVSSGTTTISLNDLGEFEAGKTYEVCFAYFNGSWVDEVFQSFVPAGPATYAITLAEGTEDADKWTISPNPAEEGAPVTATYSGDKKVKSVKAVKKEAVDPAKAYMKWDADQKKLVATDIPEGATPMTSSTTAWAGTYVVEGDVEINANITLSGNVDLIIKDGAKLTAKQIYGSSSKYNLSIYGQANKTGQLVVNSSNDQDAIAGITTLEVHSAKVTATSSSGGCSGFFEISTFNVYGGSVDGENTGSDGYGISLKKNGSMNIYGGDVKAVGKGTSSYGIWSSSATVTVYGGKLWAENADKKAIDFGNVTLTKDAGYTSGKIQYSMDKTDWSETKNTNAKYVRVGY